MQEFKKITEDFYNEKTENGESIQGYLLDDMASFINLVLSDYKIQLEQSVVNCESPVEQLLSMFFELYKIKDIHRFNPFIDIGEIEIQKEIKCGNNLYRVDFYIPVIYKNQEEKYFIIECDGYEFHQKTKEQVEKDNIRTRDLQKAGYEMIRFSGTEIWNKPYNCVIEILNIILSKCKYKEGGDDNG